MNLVSRILALPQRCALGLAVAAALAAFVVVASVVAGIALAPADGADSAPGITPHITRDRGGTADADRPIIVEVTGDRQNGFEIEYADGESLYPPTDSEANAECSEYDRRLDRVRCRVEVRTWYRDLGDLKRSLVYLRDQGAAGVTDSR